MLTPEQFVRALALTESYDNPRAWGDAGRAMGRWQVHPDWVWTWAKHYGLEPPLNATWDSFVREIVIAFASDHLRRLSTVEVAMYFHLGHISHEDWTDWDTEYAYRFSQCEQKVANA